MRTGLRAVAGAANDAVPTVASASDNNSLRANMALPW
jgi:hypothetical protein